MTMITYRESVVNHINITTGDMLAWNLRLQGVPLKCTWTVDQRSGLQHHAVSTKRWSTTQLHLKPQNQTSIPTNMTLTYTPTKKRLVPQSQYFTNLQTNIFRVHTQNKITPWYQDTSNISRMTLSSSPGMTRKGCTIPKAHLHHLVYPGSLQPYISIIAFHISVNVDTASDIPHETSLTQWPDASSNLLNVARQWHPMVAPSKTKLNQGTPCQHLTHTRRLHNQLHHPSHQSISPTPKPSTKTQNTDQRVTPLD